MRRKRRRAALEITARTINFLGDEPEARAAVGGQPTTRLSSRSLVQDGQEFARAPLGQLQPGQHVRPSRPALAGSATRRSLAGNVHSPARATFPAPRPFHPSVLPAGVSRLALARATRSPTATRSARCTARVSHPTVRPRAGDAGGWTLRPLTRAARGCEQAGARGRRLGARGLTRSTTRGACEDRDGRVGLRPGALEYWPSNRGLIRKCWEEFGIARSGPRSTTCSWRLALWAASVTRISPRGRISEPNVLPRIGRTAASHSKPCSSAFVRAPRVERSGTRRPPVISSLRRRVSSADHSCPPTGDGATSIVEMLFCTSLVALVGAGERPNSSTRRLQIVNTKVRAARHPSPAEATVANRLQTQRQSTICELTFPTTILAVKLNRRRLVVVLEERIYVYDISNMKLLHEIETSPNPQGAFSTPLTPVRALTCRRTPQRSAPSRPRPKTAFSRTRPHFHLPPLPSPRRHQPHRPPRPRSRRATCCSLTPSRSR